MTDSNPWTPAIRLDLAMATQTSFKKSQEGFLEWRKTQPIPSLMMSDGWHLVTPQMAEQFLMLNDQNRRLRLPEVFKIARQMLAGNWKKTGQTIVFNDKGRLNEGQHRCWACYLCGASFETYIVTNASSEPNIFAYYDRGAPRGLTDALQTAHFDGFAAIVAGVVNLLHHRFVAGDSKGSVSRVLPEELLDYVEANRSGAAPSDTPIGMLHEKLREFKKAKAHVPIPRTHVIAFTILAFNAWKTGAKLKALKFPTRGQWPTIVTRSSLETAAE